MKHHRLEIHLDRPHCPQFLCLVNIFLLHLLILSLALTLHVIQQILRALATKGNPGIFKISRDLKMAVYRAGSRDPGNLTLIGLVLLGSFLNPGIPGKISLCPGIPGISRDFVFVFAVYYSSNLQGATSPVRLMNTNNYYHCP